MSRGESDSPGARALRDAGYRKLPGWWVTQEQFELIVYMCESNLKDIERIKRDSER
jgi:hypothetical protein